MDIDIKIPETIEGNKAYLNYSLDITDRPQVFRLTWENLGSVSCRARMRADIQYNGSLTYAAWSGEGLVEPGDYVDLEAYYYPLYPGNYSANISMYYCNLIEGLGGVNFSASVSEEYEYVTYETILGNETEKSRIERSLNQTPITLKAENTNDSIRLSVSSSEDLGDLVIVPRKYPAGWIFEGKRIDAVRGGEDRTTEIIFIPSVFRPADIELDVATLDGRVHAVHKMRLEKEAEGSKGIEQYAAPALAAAVIILLVLLITRKRKR